MSSFISKLKAGCIGAALFCGIFSLQWVILGLHPMGTAYIPPLLVGVLSGIAIHHFRIKWEQEAAKRSTAEIKVIQEITGTVCHELGQPLQALQTGVDLLMMDTPENTDAFNDLKAMSSEIKRIKNMTGKLKGMTEYRTRDYLSGRIVDIESASPGDCHDN
ncbi:MAG: hypothetical protein MI863_05515 [Desulfobacterales bacterium]|nr:hypothetical protein [Desulfobacterales bacterium]